MLLSKEKLKQDIQQLKNQNEPTFFDWFRGDVSFLLLGLGALAGFLRWLADRRDAQDKDLKAQAEERFKTAVTALGDEKEGVQVGGAILLRSLLNKNDEKIYGRYYTQIFDLAVAYLRLPKTAHPPEFPDGSSLLPEQPAIPQPFRQVLIAVFKEVFPLAREQIKKRRTLESSFLQRNKTRLQIKLRGGRTRGQLWVEDLAAQALDATGIQLDNAYLFQADLEQAWMPQAFLRNVDLRRAKLIGTELTGADLSGANLFLADLSRVYLSEASLVQADLTSVDLTGAALARADLSGANLTFAILFRANPNEANFSGAKLDGASLAGAQILKAQFHGTSLYQTELVGAELIGADFKGADLRGANLSDADLSETNLEEAQSLEDTNLRRVKGLTKEQLETCKAKGAIIDEDAATSTPQSIVSTPTPSQGNDAQTQSATLAQVNTPTPTTDGSSSASSQPEVES
jgi:uncharacterized protein YjbI with pentapeptide repeats